MFLETSSIFRVLRRGGGGGIINPSRGFTGSAGGMRGDVGFWFKIYYGSRNNFQDYFLGFLLITIL